MPDFSPPLSSLPEKVQGGSISIDKGKAIVTPKKDGCVVGGVERTGPPVNVSPPCLDLKCSLGGAHPAELLPPQMRQVLGLSLKLEYCRK